MTANGSRRWFQYEDNRGLTYAVQLDESIYETADLGFANVQAGVDGPQANGRVIAATGNLPLRMRYVNVSRVTAAGVTERNRFFVGNPTAPIMTGNSLTVTVDGVAWNLSSTRGERLQLVPATDTGKTDGDVEGTT